MVVNIIEFIVCLIWAVIFSVSLSLFFLEASQDNINDKIFLYPCVIIGATLLLAFVDNCLSYFK